MKTCQLDVTYRAQFPAENTWAADRIRRSIEEAQVLAATQAIRDIKVTVQHRRLDEFHGGYGRFMPVRRGGDGRFTVMTLRTALLSAMTLALSVFVLYQSILESSVAGFIIGVAIWSYWLAARVAQEVGTRFRTGDDG